VRQADRSASDRVAERSSSFVRVVSRRRGRRFAGSTMSDLLGKFFGKDKDKQQGGKGRDKSPAVGDRGATGAGASGTAQGDSAAADFCKYCSTD